MKSQTIAEAPALHWIASAVRQLFSRVSIRRRDRQLRLSETLPLGDRRFLAIVECRGKEYLVGCTGSSISLLSTLSPKNDSAAGQDARAASEFEGLDR